MIGATKVDQERLSERIADYQNAVLQLEKALNRPYDEFIRDSVFQRFEFTYELGWKMLKLKLESEAVDAKTPKQVLQEALQAGLIADGNAWSSMQRQRNLTAHTYDEKLAISVYEFVASDGIALFTSLAELSRSWH